MAFVTVNLNLNTLTMYETKTTTTTLQTKKLGPGLLLLVPADSPISCSKAGRHCSMLKLCDMGGGDADEILIPCFCPLFLWRFWSLKKKCSSWICNVSTTSTGLRCHPKDLGWYSSDCPCLPLLQPAHSQLMVNKQSNIQWIKGVSFWRICGAASVGEYNRVI